MSGDAARLALGRRFPLVLAPMQLLQLLGPEAAARLPARRSPRHLDAGGRAALAIVDRPVEAEGDPPLPDVREVDGWVYSSLPLAIRAARTGVTVIRRAADRLAGRRDRRGGGRGLPQ